MEILRRLKAQGARLTQTRKLLISFLEKHRLPVSESEIRTNLAARGRVVNKTTTYRELASLVKFHVLQTVDFGDGKVRYELAGAHHHHLVCESCFSVQDIRVNYDIERIEKLAKKEKNFLVKRHSLEFFGLCKACKNN